MQCAMNEKKKNVGWFFSGTKCFVEFLFEVKLCQGFGQNALLPLVCPGSEKQLNIFTINEITGIINHFQCDISHTYIIFSWPK